MPSILGGRSRGSTSIAAAGYLASCGLPAAALQPTLFQGMVRAVSVTRLLTRQARSRESTVTQPDVMATCGPRKPAPTHESGSESGLRALPHLEAVNGVPIAVKEQAAQIQKVSAQLELSKSAPRTVLNRQ